MKCGAFGQKVLVVEFDIGPRNGGVQTTNRLVYLWLTTFRGYSLVQTMKTPSPGLWGRIVYKRRWRMEPKKHR